MTNPTHETDTVQGHYALDVELFMHSDIPTYTSIQQHRSAHVVAITPRTLE